ncbi:YjcZ family sporulation protein [Pseudalkalibacillus decolorationis]|nr:YjcZ family sporulation protein [Pseudalkalibacillus decolorationis]
MFVERGVGGYGYSYGFSLIAVFFILLIIVGVL